VAATKVEDSAGRALSAFSRQLDQNHDKTSAVFSICWESFSAKRREVTDKEFRSML
jgi:hypothetical protein